MVVAIGAAGASQKFLPRYSPDFNPIKMVFSKRKAHLRRAAGRTDDWSRNRIGALIDYAPPETGVNIFIGRGYEAD